jgi:hypothetical protein
MIVTIHLLCHEHQARRDLHAYLNDINLSYGRACPNHQIISIPCLFPFSSSFLNVQLYIFP